MGHLYAIGQFVSVRGFNDGTGNKYSSTDCEIVQLINNDDVAWYKVYHNGTGSYDMIRDYQIVALLMGPTGSGPYFEEASNEVILKFEEKDHIAKDNVNHPRHYKSHPSGVECITVTEWMNFSLGNCVKYIWRAGEKGNQLEDLKKAQWYLNREISRLEKDKT